MSNPATATPNALALLSELEARGVELRANGDRLAYDEPRGVIGDLLPDLARFKPQLLELLTRPLDGAGVHRWRDATATGDLSAPDDTGAPDVATTGSANDLPAIDHTPENAIEAAHAILDGAYFNLARGGVLCIGWQQPSRAAWQWAAIANGATLDEKTGLPSMDVAAAIDWARAQLHSKREI